MCSQLFAINCRCLPLLMLHLHLNYKSVACKNIARRLAASVSADYGLGSEHFRALGALKQLKRLESDAVNPSNEAVSELSNLQVWAVLETCAEVPACIQ